MASNLEELKMLNLGSEKEVKLQISHPRLKVLSLGSDAHSS